MEEQKNTPDSRLETSKRVLALLEKVEALAIEAKNQKEANPT